MINYYLITKPGIILGNLITVAAGFLLAGSFDPLLFLATLAGIALIIASACVFNNYIDRGIDKKMERTKKRSLAIGAIQGKNALIYGTILGVLGLLTLLLFTNTLTALVAAFGFFVYVCLYSLWKVHTIYGTAIGSIAGATPPVVGYTAVSGHLDSGALILFAMLILWQMPHFYGVALMHLKDYTKAGIPTLPILKGVPRTKIHMALYTLAFIPVSLLLTVFGFTGEAYLCVALVLGTLWLLLAIKGFFTEDNALYGRNMFRFSLFLITTLSIMMPLDRI